LLDANPLLKAYFGCNCYAVHNFFLSHVPFQRETRRVYNLLLEDSETEFQGWKIQPG